MTDKEDERLERVVEGIDRHLSYLHKERWAQRAAELRDGVRRATGLDRERAEQALRDHHADRDRPETSRMALIEQAKANVERSSERID